MRKSLYEPAKRRSEHGGIYFLFMLFMVIERFKDGDPNPAGERFRRCGRILPEGVLYHASWVDSAGARCFQVMEAPNPELLERWITHWEDLIDFEIVPVLTSSEFWAKR
jgi:hypothetical protein